MKIPIPLTVLTGFLGSGKTTLLKALLQHPDMAGTAVIVNEFGEVGLDDALMQSAKEETILLPSGCVCCAVRGDLVAALLKLHRDVMWGEIPPLSRVVIETSGLADPAPIAHTLMTEETLFRVYQLDAIVTTVDAELGCGQLDAHFEPAKQIAMADRIILTKGDRASASQVAAIRARITELNRRARLVPAANGNIQPGEVVGLAAFEPVAARGHPAAWLGANGAGSNIEHDCDDLHCTDPEHDHSHGVPREHLHGIRSVSLTFEVPLDGTQLSSAIERLRTEHGDKLLRVKGIVNVVGQPLPFVIHGVQHVFYPPSTLDEWPSDDRRSRIVVIAKDLHQEAVAAVFAPLHH